MRRRTRVPGRLTLRARLTLIHGGMFLAAGVVLLGATYALFSQQLDGPLLRITATEGGQRQPTPSPSSTGPSPSASTDASGRRTYLIAGTGTELDAIEAGTGPETGLATAAEEWMHEQRAELHAAATTSLLTQGGIALLVVGGAAAGTSWLVAGRVLAPLHRVTDTARRIAAAPAADRGLHERIALRGPDDEVKDLADTFDTMVERLDRSFDGQRRFVANASHELRTPLTLVRAVVEVAMHRRTASEDVKRLGESLLEINARNERLINGLLLLAGSERELTTRCPVDLADIVAHVVANTAAEAERAGVTVHEDAGEAPSTGDALLLERLVHNLVENAIRHNTGPDGWVRVTSRTLPDGRARLEVGNTGPLVPAFEVPTLFEPFRRLGTDRLVGAKGAGLGLSIVRSIAHAHGGEVTARARPTGGLTVTVTLPPPPP
ncbi:sensor histidine kinase [Allostreptomyces psammosilenae]|uniref:Signal transduction histidine-protein kinase/phosphatase MprB n=1 Tax=Allostreptomyces psammosilenae TaxID=1892865 RepID=A0A852ZYW2_9ACTN|nr:HAMP domain-containing sensor histidine kinase [Allostreptomyces psammosilenae]NYI07573.1 signal transduction histidine kinase [Allostreptomyces psammosilenae]